MSLNKRFLLSLFVYSLILSLPATLASLMPFETDKTLTYISLLLYPLGLGLLWQINKQQSNTSSWIPQKETSHKVKKLLIWGLIGFLLCIASQSLATWLERVYSEHPEISQNTITILQLVQRHPFYVLIVTICGPLIEEIIFRLSIVNFLNQFFGRIVATCSSALLFAFAHQDGHYLVYFLMALVLSWTYKKSGQLGSSMIAHCLMNGFAIISNLLLN